MSYIIKNGEVYIDKEFVKKDIFIDDNGVVKFDFNNEDGEIIDASNCVVMPSFIDTHVHLREPGYEYKETIETGTMSAVKGGFSDVFSMPNLKPAPDSLEHLNIQKDIIKKTAHCRVFPLASITKDQKGVGELSNIEELNDHCIGFSDDGVGVQDENLMKEAMKIAKKSIIVHCEDNSELKKGGCINEGKKSKELNLIGINNASEYNEVIRDIKLAKEFHSHLHICHVSAKESVEAIRQGKKDGVNVTAEATVHHLILTEDDLKDDGNFKMNPPLRANEDKNALIKGIKDGAIECICTDHAPHTIEEKSKGLANSYFGIIGLEFAFALVYTKLVKKGVISLEDTIKLMSSNAAKIFKLEGGEIKEGKRANLNIFDLNKSFKVDINDIASKSKNTPFLGETLQGKCLLTMIDGKVAYRKDI